MTAQSDAEDALLAGHGERLQAIVDEARAAGSTAALVAHLETVLSQLRETPSEASAEAGAGDWPAQFGMIGASEPMQKLFAMLERVAPANVPVLIQGETGAGKELVARALHDYSPRKAQPFLAENCAAVPANLLESELFGHEKGAFTGAVAKRPGHFAAADGGTVFLDEIGDMPMEMQAKLLRVLQDGEIRPVGSNKALKVDVRVVAATHRDLPEAVKAGRFREDLMFRLNVITLHVPALRERSGDVRHLVAYFLDKVGREMGRSATLQPAALEAFEAWSWPGNVRELENEVRRALALTSGEIRVLDLSPSVQAALAQGERSKE